MPALSGRAEGKAIGRPSSALTEQQRDAVLARLAAGASVAGLAREYGISRQTIMRVRDDAGDRPVAPAAKPMKVRRRIGTGKPATVRKVDAESDHTVRVALERRGQRRLVR
jgi:transposase-like protein